MTDFYRVKSSYRQRFAPYDGELYRLAGPDVIPEYILVDVGRREFGQDRPIRIPVHQFEKIEQSTHAQ